MEKYNLRELLKQPLALDLLEQFGIKGRVPEDFSPEEIERLEPLWKLVDATKLPIHVPIHGEYERKWWKEAVVYQI